MAAAENAVRTYLRYLSDPRSVSDGDRAGRLEQQLADTDDPIERLRLRARIAEANDPSRFEEGFVAHAKEWAAEHDVPPSAFAAEGVPPSVMRRAGLVSGRGRQRPARSTRRPRVSADDIRAAVPGRRRKFTSRDVQEASGASAATVRRVLAQMLAAGELEEAGPDPAHSGPGRAPQRYVRRARR